MAPPTEAHSTLARARCLALLAAALVLCAVSGIGPTLQAAASETVQLPHVVSLDDLGKIALRVDDADIVVRVDDEAKPVLRARLPESAAGATVEVSVERDQRRFSFERPRPEVSEGSKRPTILLELVVGSKVSFEIVGSGLGIQVDQAPDEAARARASGVIPETDTLPAPRWRLRIRDGQVRMVGITHATIESDGGVVQLADTAGVVKLVADGTEVESDRHAGYLRLDAVDSEIEIGALDGAIEFTLDGGQLEAFEVGETIAGNAAGGAITVDGWRGKAMLRGETTRMTVRRGAEEAELDIGGRLTDIAVDNHGGRLTADLDGGALRAETLFGPVEASGRAQATIEIAHTEKRVDLTLDHANGTVIGVPETAYFKVDDGRIEAEDVERFAARGTNAEAVVREVRRLDIVSFKNSTIDLDLTDIRHNPAIALRAATEAHIRMPMPCLVRVAGSSFAVENKVRVAGCRYMYPGNMPPRQERLPKEGERSLVVNVVDEGALDVEGVVLD